METEVFPFCRHDPSALAYPTGYGIIYGGFTSPGRKTSDMKKCIEDVTSLQLRLKKVVGQLNGIQKMLAVSALVTVLVPDGFFAEAFGGRDWLAMPAMAIIAGAILCGCAVNFFTDAATATETARCASHGLTAVHWTCAAFLVAMMAYNLIRPVKMASAKHACK